MQPYTHIMNFLNEVSRVSHLPKNATGMILYLEILLTRIQKSIIKLKDDSRPPGVKKLVGSSHGRIRVGDYRVIYRIADSILMIVVIAIGHRREIYR